MRRTVLVSVWSSFLVTIIAEGGFFSLIDPHHFFTAAGIENMSPLVGYSVGFLFIWTACSGASLLSIYLRGVPEDSQ